MSTGRRIDEPAVLTELALAFAPLHKQALGIAVGLTAGLVMAAVTIIVRVRGAATEINLNLLAAYFYGYSVSWRGVLVGFGLVVGVAHASPPSPKA